MIKRLKNCPYCGGDAIISVLGGNLKKPGFREFWIHCNNCGFQTSHYNNEKYKMQIMFLKNIRDWNNKIGKNLPVDENYVKKSN